MPRLFILILLVPWTAACSAPGASPAAPRAGGSTITLRDYKSHQTLRLVDDSHLTALGVEGVTAIERRAAFYSEKRGEISTKVLEDEVLGATIQALERSGFGRWAVDGLAPSSSGESMSLEVARGAAARHMLRRRGMDMEQVQAFLTCFQVFTEVYNAVDQYQSATPEQMRLEGAAVKQRGDG